MKIKSSFQFLTIFAVVLMLTAGCNTPAKEEKPTEISKPDMMQIRTEIQAIENEWAKASTAGDITKVMTFYSDDAVEMNDDEPMLIGKEAIQASLNKSLAARKPGSTISFETIDVFGDSTLVTEVGKMTTKDAAGKVLSAGKYMGIFEKRNGGYICIRDISNEDQKGK